MQAGTVPPETGACNPGLVDERGGRDNRHRPFELTETMGPTAGLNHRRTPAVQSVAAATLGFACQIGSRRDMAESVTFCDIG